MSQLLQLLQFKAYGIKIHAELLISYKGTQEMKDSVSIKARKSTGSLLRTKVKKSMVQKITVKLLSKERKQIDGTTIKKKKGFFLLECHKMTVLF